MTSAAFPAFKMIKLRNKIKHCLLFSLLATAIFVLYRTLAVDDVSVAAGGYGPASPKSRVEERGGAAVSDSRQRNGGAKGPRMFEDVNDLMPMTQPAEHLQRMRQHEAKMMENIQRIVKHRLHEINANNRTGNNSADVPARHKAVAPSLWRGLPNQPVVAEHHSGHAAAGDSPPVVLEKKFVHLDLKGAPPTLAYLATLFPFLRSLGANGVLLEYEDMFPYWGKLDDVRAYNSYSWSEVVEIQKMAKQNQLEVVPLVQAFGHLEFVLKRESFRGLREVPAFPQAVCPSRNETLSTLREMIDQVLELHPDSRFLHVGCDEVYNLGECAQCQERMERGQFGTEQLFLQHVTAIARHVGEKHRRRALIWDDMLRRPSISAEAIRDSGLGQHADLVVWKYGDTVEEDLPLELWSKYAECFPGGVWIASAFKGADYPASFATPIRARLDNHRAWTSALPRFSQLGARFKGIFMTGWQRFDHFATLCELLPSGLPSLAVNLAFLRVGRYDEETERHVQEQLRCSRPVNLDLNYSLPDPQCSFPGADVYKLSVQFHTLKHNLQEQFFESNYLTGWVSDYNVRTRFSSPSLIEQAMYRYGDGVRNLSVFQAAMTEALSATYDRYTVSEWLDTNVRPLLRRMDAVMADMKTLMIASAWPRRPITVPLDDSDGVRAAAGNSKTFRHATEP